MKFKHYSIIPSTPLPFNKPHIYTYKYDGLLGVGQVVKINFANRNILGVIDSNVEQTNIDKSSKSKIKEVDEVFNDIKLTPQQIELARSVSSYYHTPLGQVIKLMIPPILKRPQKIEPQNNKIINSDIVPTKEQAKIIEDIKKTTSKTNLIFGVTGSGKTEIYIQLIKDALAKNKQSIVMVPEISLTPQAIERYAERFGMDKIAVVHSNLSNSEKFINWKRIKNNEAKIIIGPRSAILSPVKDLAYIIIDEEHDSSYKQYDKNPRYHTKTVASKLADIFNAKIVLGSATPNIESYHKIISTEKSRENKAVLHKLPKRISGDTMPKVHIVDMRDEFKKRNYSIFSDLLQEKINQNIKEKRQIVLYLNRRGASTFVSCRDCGYVELCPNCDLSLTYHLNSSNLTCHHCNFSKNVSIQCPDCNSVAFKYFGSGTQRVELELTKLYPSVRILRMDRDTTQTRQVHEKYYNDFKNNKYDVLIGTQMISKGWDIPNVGLVGIISADTTLNLPDFRAGERTFQLITQVAGRTGRGVDTGEVVLQTYSPDNYIIKSAAKHDFVGFYNKEIGSRKSFNYPPFAKLIKLFFRHPDINVAKKSASQLYDVLFDRTKNTDVELLGPAPGFIPRIRNNYIYHIIIKTSYDVKLDDILKDIPNNWIIDVDPENLL